MPYLGVPFTAEGSPEGLLETLRCIRELAPRQLIEGHTTLTENFTIDALAGLEPALTELHEFALARIGENMPLAHILHLGYLPALLRDHPAAVVPYLVSRDDLLSGGTAGERPPKKRLSALISARAATAMSHGICYTPIRLPPSGGLSDRYQGPKRKICIAG
jgi:hypothetical protein